jgi:beta-glucanase (GH16 family)
MIRLIPCLLLAASLTLPATAAPAGDGAAGVPLPAALRGKDYALTKDWDFGSNIRTLDQLRAEFHTRYVYDNGQQDTLPGNGEWERYRDNDNHRIENGVLKLIAHVRGGLQNGGIESGMLRSKWTGKYGYYEIRMKVPHGRGLWPAFWLNPEDQKWPPEIDIVEIVNNGRDTTRNSFHNVMSSPGHRATEMLTQLDRWGSYRPGFDYADGFHTFAVEWTPQTVRHFVDDKLVAERRFEWVHQDGSDGGPAHVLVNLAVGGKWPEAPTSLGDFPAALEVDYIRVWQRRGAAKEESSWQSGASASSLRPR